MKKITIHSHVVSYDESHERLNHAIKYLEDKLSKDESEVFFENTHNHENTYLQDDNHTKLKLKKENNEYTLSLFED